MNTMNYMKLTGNRPWIRLVAAGVGLALIGGVNAWADKESEHGKPKEKPKKPHPELREAGPHGPMEVIARAKLSRPQAEKIARSKVPGGKIKEAELEMEDGVLQWAFDLTIPGSKLIAEVEINAVTGEVLKIEIEAPDEGEGHEKAEVGEKKHKEHAEAKVKARREHAEKEHAKAEVREHKSKERHEGKKAEEEEEHEEHEGVKKHAPHGPEKAHAAKKEKEKDEDDEHEGHED